FKPAIPTAHPLGSNAGQNKSIRQRPARASGDGALQYERESIKHARSENRESKSVPFIACMEARVRAGTAPTGIRPACPSTATTGQLGRSTTRTAAGAVQPRVQRGGESGAAASTA